MNKTSQNKVFEHTSANDPANKAAQQKRRYTNSEFIPANVPQNNNAQNINWNRDLLEDDDDDNNGSFYSHDMAGDNNNQRDAGMVVDYASFIIFA